MIVVNWFITLKGIMQMVAEELGWTLQERFHYDMDKDEFWT